MIVNILLIAIATILGFVIGMINKSVNKQPSASVFSIICMGSALVTIVSMQFFTVLGLPWAGDPGRLSAQVISALGFLGTGLIWVNDNSKVKGLSIAASLWLTAILGMLVGAGMPRIGILGFIFLIIVYLLSSRVSAYKNRERNKLNGG